MRRRRKKNPIDTVETKKMAKIFKALSVPVRLELLLLMYHSPSGELNACCSLPALKLSQPTLSYHFKVLRSAGIVTQAKRSQWVFYKLNVEILSKLADWFHSVI